MMKKQTGNTTSTPTQAADGLYQKLFEMAQDGILLLDLDAGRVMDANPAFSHITGYSLQELQGKKIKNIDFLIDIIAKKNEQRVALKQSSYFNYPNYSFITKSGKPCQVNLLIRLIEIRNIHVLQCNLGDVSSETELEKLNIRLQLMYKIIHRCNEAFTQELTIDHLIQEICDILINEGKFAAAWVGYLPKSVELPTEPIVFSGMDAHYFENLNVTCDKESPGFVVAAIQMQKLIICQNISKLFKNQSERQYAEEQGYQSVAILPVCFENNVPRVLVVYGSKVNQLTNGVLAFLTNLSVDLAFGISLIQIQNERLALVSQHKESFTHAITAIASTVEMRDPYTAGHQRRVSDLAVKIAAEMGLSLERIEGLRMACVVHDIGKIHVPAEILSNPGTLTEAEFEIIKTHPKVGFEILKGIDFPWPVAEIVYQHHEKLDGSGYPRGLKGDEILLEARILTVADVVEAMSSHRPYRPLLGVFPALQEITQHKGTLYDLQVVDACLRVFLEKKYTF